MKLFSHHILNHISKPELLSSLMFSMLKQMLEDDRNENVREAATKSLALILAFVDDSGKYTQVWNFVACKRTFSGAKKNPFY